MWWPRFHSHRYGSTSEVAWLFLLAYWIAALVVVSLGYAFWNRGLTGGLAVVGTESAEGSPLQQLTERIIGSGPRVPVFEGDRIKVRLRIKSPRGTRGPGRISASIGTTQLSTAAGLVRKEIGRASCR